MEHGELTTFVWHGQTRYCCPDCGFDSHAEVEVVRHWASTHAPQSGLSAGPVLFGADGKQILPDIVTPNALRELP